MPTPPPMKPLMIAGWIMLALEVVAVVALAVQKNMGDDAAGRGMGTGFAMILGPIVLVAGGLLLWGSFGGPRPAFWVGFCLVMAPLGFLAVNAGGNTLKEMRYAAGRAEFGRFSDARLTKIARAIDKRDTDAIQTLLRDGPLDWTARDARGQTLLGHAIHMAVNEYDTTYVPAVELLIRAGAPVTNDALSPGRTQASVSEHNLVYHLFAVHNESAVRILDLVLARGLSPDQLDEDDRPMYYSTFTTRPALEVLAKYKADFTRLDPRTDRLHQNALMNAITFEAWDEARFFLERGLSMDYTAPDGRSARSILAEVAPPGTEFYGPPKETHAAFMAALAAQDAARPASAQRESSAKPDVPR